MGLRTYTHPPLEMYESTKTLVTYAEQQGYRLWEAVGTIMLVCAMGRLGRVTDGLALLEAVLDGNPAVPSMARAGGVRTSQRLASTHLQLVHRGI